MVLFTKLKHKILNYLLKDLKLIYTSEGNLPIDDLKYSNEWQISEDWIMFIEKYNLGEKEVKRSVSGLARKGLDIQIKQGIFGSP